MLKIRDFKVYICQCTGGAVSFKYTLPPAAVRKHHIQNIRKWFSELHKLIDVVI